MRLTRQRGQVHHMRAVERAYEQQRGQFKPWYEIAAELYDDLGSDRLVQEAIRERYGVEASSKTIGLWINRGQEERRRALAAAATPAPSEAAP